MKIGILTICTGKYDVYFDALYKSLKDNFLTGYDKTFYVFTDSSKIQNNSDIKVIGQRKLGWPYDTMLRFHMFNKIEQELLKNDYLFFFNANMMSIKNIGEEIIPTKVNDYLMGAHHPGFYNGGINNFPYDRNINCSCYIPYDTGEFYVQGCFNGGRSKEFLEMSKILASNIDKDLNNSIIPLWHDESQINWYYKDKNPLVLSHKYIHPENFPFKGDELMVQLDKNRLGGHKKLRE